MRNPLLKRLPRELRNNIGRYLGMFALLVLAIMFTSGFLMAASSIEAMAGGMRERYNVSDLYFVTDFKASDEAIRAVEDLGGTVYEEFYRDMPIELPDTAYNRDIGIQVRVFKNRGEEFDQAIIAQGRFPDGRESRSTGRDRGGRVQTDADAYLRARPRARRRSRGRLHRPARRRTGHREIHAAHAALRQAWGRP